MSLWRTICVLGGAVTLLLVVVILRAESTRLHFELSHLERRSDVLVQQLREEQLELARQRNPADIRKRVSELRLAGSAVPVTPAKRKSP